jgi:signal peptidase II
MKRFALWLLFILAVIGLDQWSKLAVLARFAEGEALPVTSFFNLVLVYNPGAAFSFLASNTGWQRWFFICLAIVICSWLLSLLWQQRKDRLQPVAYALIIGGALGNNLIDRVVYGKVVDFLDFHYLSHHYPAFNVADSAICIGVVLLVLATYLETKTKKTDTPS